MFHPHSSLQSSSHLLAIYSELGEESPKRIEEPENQHASFPPVPPKSALCQVVLWTESVFFKFIVRALTAKVLCFEKGSNFLGPHGL